MKIVLKGGPLDTHTDRVAESCRFYRQRALGPNARYRATDDTDPSGFRIFEHWPPLKPGEAEPTEGTHDA
jgi:hypothetical protein